MRLLVDPETSRVQDDKQFELDGWIDTAPFEQLIGLTIDCADAGEARLSLPYRIKLANGGGVMHGGAMVTLADTAVAMAIKSLLPAGTTFATTELKMVFVAPVLEGTVTAKAKVTGPEGRTFWGECDLLGEQGQLFARFTSVFRVARGQGFSDEVG